MDKSTRNLRTIHFYDEKQFLGDTDYPPITLREYKLGTYDPISGFFFEFLCHAEWEPKIPIISALIKTYTVREVWPIKYNREGIQILRKTREKSKIEQGKERILTVDKMFLKFLEMNCISKDYMNLGDGFSDFYKQSNLTRCAKKEHYVGNMLKDLGKQCGACEQCDAAFLYLSGEGFWERLKIGSELYKPNIPAIQLIKPVSLEELERYFPFNNHTSYFIAPSLSEEMFYAVLERLKLEEFRSEDTNYRKTCRDFLLSHSIVKEY